MFFCAIKNNRIILLLILENVFWVSLNNLDPQVTQSVWDQHELTPLHNVRPIDNLLYNMFKDGGLQTMVLSYNHHDFPI